MMVVSARFFFLKIFIHIISPLKWLINQWDSILSCAHNLSPGGISIHCWTLAQINISLGLQNSPSFVFEKFPALDISDITGSSSPFYFPLPFFSFFQGPLFLSLLKCWYSSWVHSVGCTSFTQLWLVLVNILRNET